MKKLLFFAAIMLLISCGSSEVSDRPAVVISITTIHSSLNPEKYKVEAYYLDDPVHVEDFWDIRSQTKTFVIYTDRKVNVNDTIRLLY